MLPDWYKNYKTFIENSIIYYTKKYLDTKTSSVLEDFKQIIFYSISEGKRIRSILALEFYINFSSKKIEQIKKDDDIMKFCIALEMIHTCSLVHDDLPCMDNDFYRRGKLTVWKKYWEANAVLVWDFLNNITFEILSEIKNPELWQKLIKLLSKSVWFHWMIWWQVEDIYFEKKIQELNKNILENLHNKKTWALIVSSVLWWIILWTNLKNLKNYEEFAKNIWLAFQLKMIIYQIQNEYFTAYRS